MIRRKRVFILKFGYDPFTGTESVALRVDYVAGYGRYCITPTEESGLPIKPPCLYGME